MSSSLQPGNKIECYFSDIKPIEVFKYPSQASRIIWGVNSNNILQSSLQILDFIKTSKIPIQMALYLIDIFSQIRVKEIKLFSELYQKLSNAFPHMYEPKNKKLIELLHYQFENSEQKIEEILNLYSTESPLFYIAWDKVDDLKNKFPNLDINNNIDQEITPLGCAIKYGSELCFNYLKKFRSSIH
ncbi:hypothetical protein TVAG_408860 [Trichomonas vaginalis G3]|uniref:Uncharacterized protein n=1 Tax=Trichomonas vaginalis (strain ATCC PRA-98 / G3) TaxID=412133 RepID=A2G3A1_TRIV3|nr:protein ubiquitination [Trichomonas vaginalis G3]EAX88366.1 hypothetical protein TVAG_408860 [Trichomonas vaginalis G3]KAI5519590.1 protein ubiquitination [Trichomonas vaginalis G3]|eukprot:XP_001301296.1 hypothetical protein [Trichomonas vaginalis G3]